MTIDSVSATASAVDRRLRATGMQVETAVAFIGCLIVLVADTQSLSLIPLLPQLEKEYALTPSQDSRKLGATTRSNTTSAMRAVSSAIRTFCARPIMKMRTPAARRR